MLTTRPATLDDVDTLLTDVQAGFDSYVAFAPAGWVPPRVRAARGLHLDLLGEPDTWALLALDDGIPAGHVSFFPARERIPDRPRGHWRERPLIPGLVHLWQLFVLPGWWGRGVAPLLNDAATAEMRAQQYDRARLFTPTRHARARRFYERRGWTATGEEWNGDLSLVLTEYILQL